MDPKWRGSYRTQTFRLRTAAQSAGSMDAPSSKGSPQNDHRKKRVVTEHSLKHLVDASDVGFASKSHSIASASSFTV